MKLTCFSKLGKTISDKYRKVTDKWKWILIVPKLTETKWVVLWIKHAAQLLFPPKAVNVKAVYV